MFMSVCGVFMYDVDKTNDQTVRDSGGISLSSLTDGISCEGFSFIEQ